MEPQPGQGNQNSGNPANEQAPQQPKGNVARPQQEGMQQKSAAPRTASPPKKNAKPSPKKDVAKKEEDVSPFERRFKEFIKRRFGGLIGDILIESELNKLGVKDLSLLDEQQQVKTMEKVLQDIFSKHKMESAKTETIFEMQLQLALDKAAELIKQSYQGKDVELSQIEITLHDESRIEKFANEESEVKYWNVVGNISGDLSANMDVIISQRESMMLLASYAKHTQRQFNPLDENAKRSMLFEFLSVIFNAVQNASSGLIGKQVSYSFDELKDLDVDSIDSIKKRIADLEKKKGGRADVASAKMDMKVSNQPSYEILVFVAY